MRSSWWLGELHLQRRAEIGRQMQAKTCKHVPKSKNILKPVTNTFRFEDLGGRCRRWNWIRRIICWTETSHTQKMCYIYIYIHTRMKVLIRHSAHFAPSCSIAHSPLLRQSSISYCIQIQCSYDKLGQVQRGLFAQEKAGKPSMFVHLPQIWKIMEVCYRLLQIVTVCSCIFLTSSSLILPAFARTIKISSASWPLTWMRNDAEWCG